MTTWIKHNKLGFVFLSTLVVGLTLIAAAAFTISMTAGLLVSGTASIAGGHWVTYLKTTGSAP